MADGQYIGLRQRQGDWMQTFTGRQFWPLDPRVGEVSIIDIASGLSKLSRYGGQCLRFYSVAEHSVLIARKLRADGLPIEECRAGLLHDASEAYLADIIRPIKPFLGGYYAIEDRLMRVISQRFRFPCPWPESVDAADVAILHDEMLQNMAPPPARWKQIKSQPLGVTLQCWSPDQAFVEFLKVAAELGCAQ